MACPFENWPPSDEKLSILHLYLWVEVVGWGAVNYNCLWSFQHCQFYYFCCCCNHLYAPAFIPFPHTKPIQVLFWLICFSSALHPFFNLFGLEKPTSDDWLFHLYDNCLLLPTLQGGITLSLTETSNSSKLASADDCQEWGRWSQSLKVCLLSPSPLHILYFCFIFTSLLSMNFPLIIGKFIPPPTWISRTTFPLYLFDWSHRNGLRVWHTSNWTSLPVTHHPFQNIWFTLSLDLTCLPPHWP